MSGGGKNLQRTGEQSFQKMDKINAEVFTLTYGSMVQQLLKDHEDVGEVNAQLEKMGYGIGQRLIDELLAKSGVGACADLRETAEVMSKVGFKMFLGVAAKVLGSQVLGFGLLYRVKGLVVMVFACKLGVLGLGIPELDWEVTTTNLFGSTISLLQQCYHLP
mmetsp:Transcript_13126/g.20604  ORF Transcript_13126/g.20604 Transcript_13126/m.20604 type:complete len:162 (+) Transcript_13126:62-547(+)